MFCEYCLQLLDFSQGVTPHAPQEKPLGGDSRPFSSNHTYEQVEAPVDRMNVYEDDIRSEHKALWWKAPIPQNESQNVLSHSPNGNCAVCNMIFSNVSATIIKVLRRSSQDNSNLHFVYKLDKARSLSIWLEFGSHLLPMIHLDLTFATANESPRILSIGESPNTRSLGSTILVASWLENCLVNHPQCKRQSGNQNRSPTRLIDVTSANDARAPYIWSPGTIAVTYVTLSHRWGNHEPLTLTKASLAAMNLRIEVEMLSQTSQDAIAIIRSLGLRYLWIDSLCIIQDDVVDWQKESANMAEIFKFSLFTIAASWASSMTEGCFFDRGALYAKLPLPNGAQESHRALEHSTSARSHKERLRLSRQRCWESLLPPEKLEKPDRQTSSFHCILKQRDTLKSPNLFADSIYNLASGTLACSLNRSLAPTSRHTRPNRVIGEEDLERAVPSIQHKSKENHAYLKATPHISDQPDLKKDLVKVGHHPKPGTHNIGAHHRCRDIEYLYVIPSQRDLWQHSVESSPLNRRAWVLQERLLSPRTVFYTRTQLFWECRESKACESSAVPLPKFNMQWDGSLDYLKRHELHGPNLEPWHLRWPEIVEQYTDTSRTKVEDKLVAISGLAREIESITKDKYCAGIWRKDMVPQLLWRLSTPQHKVDRPYQAPSWSWASTEGKVEYQRRDFKYVTPMLDIINVQSIGIDGKAWSFGQIEYGSIRTRGVLRPALRCYRYGQRYKLLLTDRLDEGLDAIEGDYYPDSIPEVLPEKALCLPIARMLSGASLGEDGSPVKGIIAGIVTEPTGEFQDEYRRLGVFHVMESAGVVWFRQNHERDMREITLI